MSDKSNKFGYVGADIPAQGFQSNKGVFNPAEINELVADNKWTQYGQLELIQTQTASGTATTLDFTSIQESTYNVHFMTYSNVNATVDSRPIYGRFFENGVEESASVYQYAEQYNYTHANGEQKSTGQSFFYFNNNTGTGTSEVANGYIYFYNLGDSTKYSFATKQIAQRDNDGNFAAFLSSIVLPQTSTVDGIRIYVPVSGNLNGTFSLYGIKEYS